jgi:hypothetical protein
MFYLLNYATAVVVQDKKEFFNYICKYGKQYERATELRQRF